MATKKFGDTTYRTDPLPATEAIALYADLMRIATKATGRIGQVVSAMVSQDDGSPLADIAAIAAIGDILRSTQSDEIVDLMKRILAAAEVQRPSGFDEADFDQEFTGKLDMILPVMRWIVMEQYADFFTASGGGGLIKALKAALHREK